MSTSEEDPKYLSRIRTELDALLLGLKDAESEESVEQSIECKFPVPKDHAIAKAMYEHRRLLRTENTSQSVVWRPIVAESALTEFLPQGPAIARGSTSEIYICETRFSKITFVVKLLVHDRQRIMTSLALRELQALIRRRHPNVVSVLDAGHLHVADGEQYPYVAMEKLDGVTLYEWFGKQEENATNSQVKPEGVTEAVHVVSSQRVFNTTIAAEIVSVLANAIQFCHEDKVTHGDISPNNVMVCGPEPTRTTLKLIDFGLSGLGGETQGFGDPANHSGDQQCLILRDIYSLGAMLYFCATGKQPLNNIASTIERKQRLDQASWLHEHATWVETICIGDESFTLICRKALSTIPESRYQSANELEDDLNAWLGDYPLPHAQKNGYRWWQKERLLWRRARLRNDFSDQAQVVGRLCILTIGIVVYMCFTYSILRQTGMSPVSASEWAGSSASWMAIALVSISSVVLRFQKRSIAVFEPVVAALVSFEIVRRFVVPQNGYSPESWGEISQSMTLLLFFLGIVNVSYAAGAYQWRAARPVGWTVIIVACFYRMFSMSTYGPAAAMWILGAVEVACCANMARYILISSPSTLVEDRK